jgi:hypothetical protein
MFNHPELLPGSPLPDFTAMSRAEAEDWLKTHDHSELIKLAMKGQNVDGTMVVNFRAPASMVAQLDQLAGRDVEGRSGVIRRAVADYLERQQHGSAA